MATTNIVKADFNRDANREMAMIDYLQHIARSLLRPGLFRPVDRTVLASVPDPARQADEGSVSSRLVRASAQGVCDGGRPVCEGLPQRGEILGRLGL